MKKVTRFLTALLALIIIFALSSCSLTSPLFKGNTKEQKMMTKINDKMGSYDSFEIALTMDIKYFVDDVAASAYTEGKQMTTGLVSGDFQTYTKTETEVSSDDLDEKQRVSSKEGYYDGKYFLTTKSDYYNQKIYSPLTAQEAYEFVMEHGMSFSGYLNCENAKVSTKDNGDVVFACSGYSKAALENIYDYFGVDDSIFDVEISDVEVTITADSSYCVKEVSLDFVFEKSDNSNKANEMKIVEKYSAFNETHIDPAMINLKNHTEVYDIRILREIDDMLNDLYDSSYKQFDLSVSQTEKMMGKTYSKEGSSEVVYGENENGYFYEIKKDNGDIIKYEDGYEKLINSNGGTDSSEACSEEEARTYVESLINTGGFYIPGVTDIEKISEGVYQFVCSNKAAYETVYQGWRLGGVNQTITFTVDKGKIVKIVSNVRISGEYIQYPNYYGVSITIDSTLDFEPQKNENNFVSVKSNESIS